MNVRIVGLLILTIFFGCEGDSELEQAASHYNRGEYQKAIDAYTEYIRLNPASAVSFYNRGRSWQELGEYDRAIKDFEKVIEIDEGHVKAHISIGMDFYQRKKDYKKAIVHMNEALNTNPSNAEAFTIRGRAYQHLGDVAKASKDYNAAISVNNEYGEAYFSRGTLKLYEKNNSGACADFRMASNLGSENGKNAYDQYCQ